MTKNVNERAADNIRILSMAMVEKANSGHPGRCNGRSRFHPYTVFRVPPV